MPTRARTDSTHVANIKITPRCGHHTTTRCPPKIKANHERPNRPCTRREKTPPSGFPLGAARAAAGADDATELDDAATSTLGSGRTSAEGDSAAGAATDTEDEVEPALVLPVYTHNKHTLHRNRALHLLAPHAPRAGRGARVPPRR